MIAVLSIAMKGQGSDDRTVDTEKLERALVWQKTKRVEAERAVVWQKAQRHKRLERYYASSVDQVIEMIAPLIGVSAAAMKVVGRCESHLYFMAQNGQFKGLFQLGARHRLDALIRRYGWTNVLAQVIHTARYVKKHGWSEWQCSPEGGLRW